MKTPREMAETALNLRRFPITLKAEFKAWCCQRGYPMEVVIEALVRDCVEQNRKLHTNVTLVLQNRRSRKSGRSDSIYIPPKE